ncbi:MAG: ABC transporter ATP-binding protein [Alphaproteobacteria bacterium]|nr:ABC transporter ATP-binding protein [Alphaproteobacteria bacterium]
MITIGTLSKAFVTGDTPFAALREINLTIKKGSFFTLLGPSGCGKTTLLRCIAGLETPTAGQITIGDVLVFSSDGVFVPSNKRRVGMVFQSYAIWPHMTVFQNVAFPLEVQHQTNIPDRVMRVLQMVSLDQLANRSAAKLSGGQQQRVALACAIVAEPDVLLFDEPLSNLDAALRARMRAEISNLQRSLGLTALYVTHDQGEALAMSDEIAVMKAGRIIEVSTPEELYNSPKTLFSAEFVGASNLIPGRSAPCANREGYSQVDTALGLMIARGNVHAELAVLSIRPERIRVASATTANLAENEFDCVVRSSHFTGDRREVELTPVGTTEIVLRASIPVEFRLNTKGKVRASVLPNDVSVFRQSA